MKLIFASLCALGILSSQPLAAQTKKSTAKNSTPSSKEATSPLLKNTNDSLSYALGIDVANNLKNAGFEIQTEIFTEGLKAALKGDGLLLTEDQKMEVIQQEFLKAYQQKVAEQKRPGEEFLEQNKKRAEVKVTEEGVQYEILREGDGAQPTAESEVEVHYRGTLIDGTQFDSSYDRNEPIKLYLNRVIEGWKIGIPLMKVGSKYKFYVPQHLGYGERDSGPIPPYSTLIFEVELLNIY